MVNYFEIKSAIDAYTKLQKGIVMKPIIVEYIHDPNEQLTSINESSDSSRSEEGSESEKKAREDLETTKEKIKREYEMLDEPLESSTKAKLEEFQKRGVPSASQTAPLPYISAFANSQAPLSTTMQFPHHYFLQNLEQTFNYSDSSFDNDTLSEG